MSHHTQANVLSALTRSYGLDVASLVPGPRQFVAETYVATNTQGFRYFCKVTFKASFIPAILASLEAMEQLHERLSDRICSPVRTLSGALHSAIGEGILVVLDFVPGEASYGYEYVKFGETTAQIHEVGKQLTCAVPTVSFADGMQLNPVIERLDVACQYNGDAPDQRQLRNIARGRIDRFRRLDEVFRNAAHQCSLHPPPLVTTHGDAPGNVLVRTADDFTIIDWDDIMLAPAERDLWVMEHEPDVLRGYRRVRPGFTVDPDARLHSILRYMFAAAGAYLDEIEAAPTDAARRVHLSCLNGLLDGWMSRLLGPIERGAR